MKRKVALIGLLVLGGLFFYAAIAMTMRAAANGKIAQHIRRALSEAYPEIKCDAGAGSESGVHLRVFGVIEPAKQTKLKDWVVRWKADNEINVSIWLQFQDDDSLQNSNSFDFSCPNTFEL